MSKSSPPSKADLPTLLAGIAEDAGALINQQAKLLRAEVKQEVRRAGQGAVEIAAGGGLAAAGGILSGMMLAHLLERTTRLPLWACYGVVGGTISAASFALLQAGRQTIADVDVLPPPESAEALKENVEWLTHQIQTEAMK